MEETLHPRRALDIKSAQNIRDLGGYSTEDGRTTKWGRFVRSGDMDRLTRADQKKLIGYGIRTVIDLRMAREVNEMPNVFSQSREVNFYNHDFWGDRFVDYRSKNRQAAAEVKLADLYCSGLIESGFIMADIMTTIADTVENGFAYHCRSGKDRTGLVSALLLAVARVPEDTICADYALTSCFLSSADAEQPADPKQPGYYLRGCAPKTMALTLAFLQDRFSGVEGYLRHLGITEQQLHRIRAKLRE